MQKTLIISALAAASLALTAASGAAETVSISVPYGDLDLSSEQGMQTLQGRINAASTRICGKAEVRNVNDAADQQRCVAQTSTSVSVAIARLTGNSRVLALNSGGTPRR